MRRLYKKSNADFNSEEMYQKPLTVQFIEDNRDSLNWTYLSRYQKLNDAVLRKFVQYLDWDEISQHQQLDEYFIKDFADRVNWDYIITYQPLTDVVLWVAKNHGELTLDRLKILKFRNVKSPYIY